MTRLAALAALAALMAGCGLIPKGRFPRHHPQPPTFSQYHLAGWEWQPVDRVLVLPFLNESPFGRAGDEVRTAFTAQLQREGRFEVVATAPDDRAALAAEVHRGGRFDEAAMIALARRTGADVVVHGIVTHYSPYPRPRMGLILQAVGPREAKVVASVDGVWDTTDSGVAERCRIYYRQVVHPPRPVLRNNLIVDDDRFAGDIALDSPALFQRWVCYEAIQALLGKPVPGVVSPRPQTSAAAGAEAAAGAQSACVPDMTAPPVGKVK